jgi:hypothetical protein
MTKIERAEDWITACVIWLALLFVIATIVIALGIGYAIVIGPLSLYEYVRRELRRS